MAIPFSRTLRSLSLGEGRPALQLATGAVLLSAWSAWFFFAKVDVHEASKEARLEVEAAPHPVQAAISGNVIRLGGVVGQRVNKGDVLIDLDATVESLKLAERKKSVEALERRIEVLKAEIGASESVQKETDQSSAAAVKEALALEREAVEAHRFAKEKADVVEPLAAQGHMGRLEGIEARAEEERRKATSEAMRATAARLKYERRATERRALERGEQLRGQMARLEGELGTTRAEIETLERTIEKHRLRAPIDGRIGEIAALEPGTYVREGDRVATILPEGKMKIVAQFPPSSAFGRIRPAQGARMRLDGFPWTQFGTVEARVATVAAENRDGLVRVDLEVDAASSGRVPLEHGMPGTVEVLVESVAPAVLVLRAAGRALD
jgi:multidrug resistance efflux pump